MGFAYLIANSLNTWMHPAYTTIYHLDFPTRCEPRR